MTRPKQFFFVFAGIAAAITCAGLVLYIAKQQSLAGNISQLEQLYADNQVARQRLADLKDLKAQYEQVEPFNNRVELILPDSKAQSEATAELAAITASHNLPFDNLSFESTSGLPNATSQTEAGTTGDTQVMAATFSTSGSYSQLQSLLNTIENNLRHMRVDSISINRDPGGELEISIIVHIYLRS